MHLVLVVDEGTAAGFRSAFETYDAALIGTDLDVTALCEQLKANSARV